MSEPPHVDGVSHRWVRARGIDFHLAEAGSGDDVVLCLHGWPQHWYEWRHLMPALADRHRVVAIDLRGFEFSDFLESRVLKSDDLSAANTAHDPERVRPEHGPAATGRDGVWRLTVPPASWSVFRFGCRPTRNIPWI